MSRREPVIGVVGLSYVDLAYAMAFSLHGFRVVGVDVNEKKVEVNNAWCIESVPNNEYHEN